LLARHCTEAGLIEKAAGLWGKAGQQSLTRSALIEAVAHFTRPLAQVAALPATAPLRRDQIKLQVGLASALTHVKGYAAHETKSAFRQARELIEQAEAVGEPLDDPLLLFSVLQGLWLVAYVAFDGDLMRELAAEFLALAEEQGSTVSLMYGHRVAGSLGVYRRYCRGPSTLYSGARPLRSCRTSPAGDAIWHRLSSVGLVHAVVDPLVAWLS
jgi:hypothetical protein